MKKLWAELRIAGAFLTRLPVASGVCMEPCELARSMGLFPAVGLALGLGLALLDVFLGAFLPGAVVNGLLLSALVWVTGALHLDGLADLTDGLAGGRTRQRALEIMKDSRVGALGAVALILALLLKYVSLTSLPAECRAAALVFMPAAGRWIQVMLAGCCRYVRAEGGTGGAFVDHLGLRETSLATGTLTVAALLLFGLKAAVLLPALVLALFVLIRYFEKRLGGVTGDVLGAATELMEILTLLVILSLF